MDDTVLDQLCESARRELRRTEEITLFLQLVAAYRLLRDRLDPPRAVVNALDELMDPLS